MAGTIPLALSQQVDANGVPLAGALLYFFQAGTVAQPQDSFQDYALSVKNPNPIAADQAGRIPMFYLADGAIHVRLTDANGVVIFDYPNMQVIGPSSGSGGGGGGVDSTALLQTGDFKWRPTSEVLSGWVRANAKTIGSAISGATERANDDTQNLFVYLWTNFTNAQCPVSGGRGVSALGDFSANKTIAMPDLRSKSPYGLDDMGNVAAGIIQASNVTTGTPTTAYGSGGEPNHILGVTEIPSHGHAVSDPGHTHTTPTGGNTLNGGTSGYPLAGSASGTTGNSATGISVANTGGGGAHNNMPPFVLGTWFVKL